MPRSVAVGKLRQIAGAIKPAAGRLSRLNRVFAAFWPTLAVVSGWSLITAGIAAVTSPLAWLFSAGLLLVSLVGWKPLATVVIEGLPAQQAKEQDDA